MLHLNKRLVAVVAACLTWGSIAVPTDGATVGANPALGQDVTATLTAKHGNVFKRAFRDWNREQWGEPEQAVVSDQLREGMQIGTGNESWAEVTWPSVKTRAWANTVFAVAPNKRLVYLTGGEMLFRLDKNRKDKEDYYIWTKVLQARIRGTTVLVQAKGPVTRFTVMEGVVEVKNRLDNSRTTLRPGVVFEVKGYNISNRAPMPNLNSGATTGQTDAYTPSPLAVPKTFDGSINDVAYDSNKYLPLFQDKFATTNLYAANSHALLNHPLVNAGQTIDSLPLIQEQQKDLPGYHKLLPIKFADTARLNKVVFSAVQPVAVPSKADYFIGQSVGKGIKLPAAAYGDLPPKGMVLNPAATNVAGTVIAPNTAVAPRPAAPPIPMLVLPVPEDSTPASVFEEEPTPLPEVRFGAPTTSTPSENSVPTGGDVLQSNQIPSLVPTTCLTPTAMPGPMSTSAFQPIPGAMPSMPMPTINGVLTPGTTTSSSMGATSIGTTPMGGAVAPIAQPLNSTVNTLNNTVNGTLNILGR